MEAVIAILTRLTQYQIESEFQYYGLFVGVVPVYVAEIGEGANLQERNWVPFFVLWIFIQLFNAFCLIASSLVDDFEPMYPIRITGEIGRRG